MKNHTKLLLVTALNRIIADDRSRKFKGKFPSVVLPPKPESVDWGEWPTIIDDLVYDVWKKKGKGVEKNIQKFRDEIEESFTRSHVGIPALPSAIFYGTKSGEFKVNDHLYIFIISEKEADKIAKSHFMQVLADDPDVYGNEFFSAYVSIPVIDRREIANEEADGFLGGLDNSFILDSAGKTDEYDNIDNEDMTEEEKVQAKEEILDAARQEVRDENYDEVYAKLSDPVNYFMNELGIYDSIAVLLGQGFIKVDYGSAAEDEINNNGWWSVMGLEKYEKTENGIVYFRGD